MTELQLLKVSLKGGAPWGFRLQGGLGTPLLVSMVRRKSKAYNNLLQGDLLTTVNGVPCNDLSYDQVMAIADKGIELYLEIQRQSGEFENGLPKDKHLANRTTNQQPNTTLISSTEERLETEKIVTEELKIFKSSESLDAKPCFDSISSATSQSHANVENLFQEDETDISCSEKFKEIDLENQIEREQTTVTKEYLQASPISDVLTKTSTEQTPTSNFQTFEKQETEKFRETSDNVETTVVRTDFEKLTKSEGSSLPPKIADLIEIADLIGGLDGENSKATVKTETYETKKTEIKTTRMNGFFSSPDTNLAKDAMSKSSYANNTNEIPKLDTSFGSSLSSSDMFSSADLCESTVFTKKKKMFSSSSFYEEPQAIYPTMEEQFEMAKKIAESLADDTNKKSKGANMFFKRAKRSSKWIHEGSDFGDENSPSSPDVLETSSMSNFFGVNDSEKKHAKLKLLLDPRHPLDLASLRSTGHVISEHNVISPDICHDLVRDLESPAGKGSALFAKRKKKSAEWIVDEEKVKSLMRAQETEQMNLTKTNLVQTPKSGSPYISPWNTALDSPRRYDPASKWINPDHLAETVIKAADIKRRDSEQSQEDYRYDVVSPLAMAQATPAALQHDIYRAKAPKGWSTTSPTVEPHSSISQIPVHSGTMTHASTEPKKYNFQNFNTLPRKWKAQY